MQPGPPGPAGETSTVFASDFDFPKLRPVEAHPIVHGGRPSVLLRDPLRLSRRTVVVPRDLAPVLVLCDGTFPRAAMSEALARHFGLRADIDIIDTLLAALNDACLLDNDRSREAELRALDQYRAAPFRSPAMAEAVYPAAPDALRGVLDGYLRAEPDVRPATAGRGLFSPHIDYARGGPVYARVWKRAAALANDVDRFVIFGTDHFGEPGRITLTRQHYATPYGVLPTDRAAVDALAAALGPDRAFGGELRHRDEHAIELVAVWLHHLRGGKPCTVVPILCGGFGRFVAGDADPRDEPAFERLLAALDAVTAGADHAVVVSGDLSHVGPAFGGAPVDDAAWGAVQAADDGVLGRLCDGDADGFFATIAEAGDAHNVCGLPPGYLALRFMGPGVRGEAVGYERCPADDARTSWVSVGGVVWG